MKWGRGSSKPYIDITNLTYDTIQFTLHNADVSLANALRRIMLSEIPCLAIEIVTVLENDSPLHDEYIAHRLGLLPIDSNRIDEFEYRDKCSCSDKCSKCTVDYNLQVTCTEPFQTVTHLDIVPEEYDTPLPLPRSGDGIPIVKIRQDQSIHVKLTATKGIGKLHAKWVVANVAYQIEPIFKINTEIMSRTTHQDRGTIAASCPRRILATEDEAYGGTIKVINPLDCIYCDSCVNVCKDLGFQGLIRIEPDETKFHFSVESTGAIAPEKIVGMALDFLEEKIKMLHQSVTETQSRVLGVSSTTAIAANIWKPTGSAPPNYALDLD